MLEEVRQEERSKLSRFNPSSSTITRSDPKLDAMPGVRVAVAENTTTVTENSSILLTDYAQLRDTARFRTLPRLQVQKHQKASAPRGVRFARV
jgi:hypothetical protein